VHINAEFPDRLRGLRFFAVRSAFEEILCGGTRGIACRDLKLAARDFVFQPPDTGFQFMCGKGGNIFAELKVRQFLAWAEIVAIHGQCFPKFVFSAKGALNIAQRAGFVMQAVDVESPGPRYRLVLREVPSPQPGSGEILIRVAAAGLNHADLLQARGGYPPPPGASGVLGMEVSGTVAAIGEDVTGFALGDRVCALIPGGGYAEYAAATAVTCLAVPDKVDLADAASFPEALFTVWTNLFDSARLLPGERVLVHGGSSGIGVNAIQLLAARGHDVFTTAGSDEKAKACMALGARRAINYKLDDFVAVIERETGGKGVNVILDMVGGDYIQRNMAAAAPWGRIVNIAYMKGAKAEINFMPLLTKRLALMGSTLRSRSVAQKGAIRDALLREVWPSVAAGRIKPVVAGRLPLAEAQKAHEIMAASGHIGKILLLAG
jgi:putative PIG3 family NAD(P)H quinone oxidoreductase